MRRVNGRPIQEDTASPARWSPSAPDRQLFLCENSSKYCGHLFVLLWFGHPPDHNPLPFSGQTLIADNALHRCGGVFWREAQKFGAITLYAQNRDITGVTIRDTDIFDSTYDGIQFKSGGGNMPGVAITGVRIDRSNNGAGILAQSSARGSATLTDVTITNSATGDIVREPGSAFVITGD
ncbi:hypothetical protein [Nonomuraea candida]|uniref:hypothetical protein n=1 Tax=Nonomuraea candida TaxID=359159 RepID=UPI0005BBB8B5|nr:hypothetical protein [Nonomuraea candida]